MVSACCNCGYDGLGELIPSGHPIPGLLENNHYPLDAAILLACNAIADITPALRRLEAESARVRSVLNELERCRDALRKYRRK